MTAKEISLYIWTMREVDEIFSAGLYAFLTEDAVARRYLTGFDSSFGIVLITENEKILYTDARYKEEAANCLKGSSFIVKESKSEDAYREISKKIRGKKTGYLRQKTSVSDFEKIKDTGANLIPCDEMLANMRKVKSAEEIELIKRACQIAESAYLSVVGFLKEGVSERDIAAELEYRMKKLGADDRSFDTIVAFGKNSAVPHHKTGADKLVNGNAVLIDFGCKVGGYCSDMTRTLYFGKAEKAFVSAYEKVESAHLAAKEMIRESMSVKCADKTARGIIDGSVFAGRFIHSLGHGVGLEIHEGPYVSSSGTDIFEKGNVFSVEPGIYIPGQFGIRIEDTVCIYEERAESLMTDKTGLRQI